jgi:hypothetical protein
VPRGKIQDAVLANFHPDRSGDIYIVFEPHWFIADFDGLHVASAHGSPWTYDTHVPIIVAGPGIAPGRVARRVETVDVAPTIAAYLNRSGALGHQAVARRHPARRSRLAPAEDPPKLVNGNPFSPAAWFTPLAANGLCGWLPHSK